MTAARVPWLAGSEDQFGGGSEHARMWQESASAAGLPEGLRCNGTTESCAIQLPIFTSQNEVKATFGMCEQEYGTVAPRPFTPLPPAALPIEAVRHRRIGLDELAQLPDFSYSLSDWAAGNEACPAGLRERNTLICHNFEQHMGALNSNHFLPQAERYYAHYHSLAMAHAKRCHDLKAAVLDPARGGPESPSHRYRVSAAGMVEGRLAEFLLECEKTALAYEAVANHFLQDAWSSGHMWERWGSPKDDDIEIGDARLVAAASGMIHGARGTVRFLHDAMCAPDTGVSFLGGAPSYTVYGGGIGDLYWDSFANVSLLEPITSVVTPDPSVIRRQFGVWSMQLEGQKTQLLNCAASSMRRVYEAAGQNHGPTSGGTFSNVSEDAFAEACFGQRATNRALWLGARQPIDLGEPTASARNLTKIVVDSLDVSEAQGDRFRRETAFVWAWIRHWAIIAPDAATVASGFDGIGEPSRAFFREQMRLMGVGLNSDYNDEPSETSYVDRLPDAPVEGLRDGEKTVLRTFHRGNADRICAGSPDAIDLEGLRDRMIALRGRVAENAGDESATIALAAAREACVEIVRRHVRVIAGGSVLRQPLCFFAADSPTVIEEPGNQFESDAAVAARYCGGDVLEILVATGDPGGPLGQAFASFDSKVSVNDDGRVAFAGSNPEGASAGFIAAGPGLPERTSWESQLSERRFAGAAISDATPPQAAFRELVPGSPPTYLIRRWDAPENSTLVGRSSGIIGGLCDAGSRAGESCFLNVDCPIFGLSILVGFGTCVVGPSAPFDEATFWLDMNDDGVVTFLGVVDGARALFAGRDETDLRELQRFSQFASPLIRPQISDSSEVVFRDEAGAVTVITSTGDHIDVVAAAPQFDAIGDRPGISADGRLVALTGSQDGADGVFLFGRGGLLEGEEWKLVGTDGDPGTPEGAFTTFPRSMRYAVSVTPGSDPDRSLLTVVFAATRSYTPSDMTSPITRQGIYRMTAVLDQSILFPPRVDVLDPPRAIVEVDSVLPLNGKTVASFDLWDPLSDNGLYTAFWVSFTDGSAAILRQTGHPAIALARVRR